MIEGKDRSEFQQAIAMQRTGRVPEAASIYRRILAEAPENPEVLHYLGLACMQLGSLDEACSLLSRARQLCPSSANILADSGTAMARAEQPAQAVELFARALEIDERHPDALNNMGLTLRNLQRPYDALPYFDRLVTIRGESADAWSQLAETNLLLNDPERAILEFRTALKLAPERERERVLLGEALEASGRFKEAHFQYTRVFKKNPRSAVALAKLLVVRSIEPDPAHATAAQKLLRKPDLEADERVRLYLALGHYYDLAGQYDLAFESVAKAHKLRSSKKPFSRQGFSAAIDRLVGFFTPELFRSLPLGRVRSTRPIFIVGMPRSGTTLVEQILASHSKVAAGGELTTVMSLCSRIEAISSSRRPYPEGVRDLSPDDFDRLTQVYLDRLRRVSVNAERVTDKLPFNYMHLGLIAILFPQAKIIHCRRDAFDTCLSCFFVSFADELQFASNLETLGHYYLDYQRLMQHWEDVLPVPVLHLDYERMVQHTESNVRELLGFCDLEWDENCLSYYRTERGVRTPSRWQVRQPIYSQSIGRWRRYQNQLEPLRQIIQLH